MLRRDVFVLHRACQFLGASEDAHHVHAHAETVCAADGGDGCEFLFKACLEHRKVDAADREYRREQSFRFLCKREQHVRRRDLLMIAHRRNLLRRLERGERARCVFILFHNVFLRIFVLVDTVIISL